jgi:pyrimidine operon attenuation protein/uracil phosphoribosyltransferase
MALSDNPRADGAILELREVLDGRGIRRSLRRMAREIVEGAGGVEKLAIVGIQRGGVHLARRIINAIEEDEGQRPAEGMIDITLYRDDLLTGLPHPIVGRTSMGFNMDGVHVVLVDDVLYTGRTVRSAIDALIDYGRPKTIRLCVLLDRGLRELPIQPDVVGLTLTTRPNESVRVELVEAGCDRDRVVLREVQ